MRSSQIAYTKNEIISEEQRSKTLNGPRQEAEGPRDQAPEDADREGRQQSDAGE
jgi:hypothetical protein